MKKFNKIQKEEKGSIITNNIKTIIGFAVGLAVGLLLMFILWPDRIAKLSNGEEVVVSLKGKDITADDLYNKLKENYSLNSIVDMIDQYILSDKYDLEEEANKYAEEQSKSIFEQYSTYYGYSKDDFLSSQGFKNENDFKEYLKVSFLYETYIQEYVGDKISDSEINDFYKDNVIGERKIVILSSTSEKNSLDSSRAALKKNTSISDLKKKYDDLTINEETVTYEDYLNYDEAIWKKIKSLNEKSYSEVIKDTSLGNVVVYVSSVSDKPDLDDIKDNIIKLVIEEKLNKDKNLYIDALVDLRESYDIDFKDTVVKKSYEDYIKESKKESKAE